MWYTHAHTHTHTYWLLLRYKKEWNIIIFNKIVEYRENHTKWNESYREIKIYAITSVYKCVEYKNNMWIYT